MTLATLWVFVDSACREARAKDQLKTARAFPSADNYLFATTLTYSFDNAGLGLPGYLSLITFCFQIWETAASI